MKSILSFDLEEWWTYKVHDKGSPNIYIPRLERYLEEVLDVLDETQSKATFFCLGQMAVCNPEIIKKVATRGHHIGCHSHNHRFWLDATYKDVEEDTYAAVAALEDVIGKKVDAYRAPAFSITHQNTWIFEILAKNGILYDSSIFPTSRSFGGFVGFTARPTIISYQGFEIKEFPIPVCTLLNKPFVFSGGGYFRLFPYRMIRNCLLKSSYSLCYFHIRDFDVDQVRTFKSLEGENSVIRYFKSYYGLANCYKKFQRLIHEFHFTSLKEYAEELEICERKIL